ncbi:hypothetical protein PO909_026552 [Leuciscus waleckii]
MKNLELANTADYVCVYAFKEEEVETALKRDGRFIDKIFQKLCVLSQEYKGEAEKNQRSRYEMSDLAEDLNQKTFHIIAIGDRRPETQMKLTKTSSVPNLPSAADSEKNDLCQHPTNRTGFLLFDRFILTNAHVVEDFVYSPPEAPHTHKLSGTLAAVFNHEVVGSETINLQAKSDLIAYRYEKDEKLRCHDYALLELKAAPDNCTELLTCYKHGPSPNSGGIYIVGHPDCGVKKMDLCFIIGIENQLQSINKHRSENVSCPYVSWQCWPNLYKNQITYNSCFFHGSSGSPVFDAHGNLIGMHTGGFHYKEGERDRSVIEFSYSMQPIMESIITQVKTRSDIIQLLKGKISDRDLSIPYFHVFKIEDF